MARSSGFLRAYALVLALILALVVYAMTFVVPSGPVAPRLAEAATPAVTVTAGCTTNPETTRVKNNRTVAITVRTIGSIYQPRSNEPFAVNRTIAAGGTVIFRSGYAASSTSVLTLTRQYIYENNVGTTEGARVATSAGTFADRCG